MQGDEFKHWIDLERAGNNFTVSDYLDTKVHTVFHYTSPDAFLSIMNDGKLRFTDRNYLNDVSEGRYVFDLCLENSKAICEGYEAYEDGFVRSCEGIKKHFEEIQFVYQCSFSTDSDSLCLWNYYTRGNSIQGYNLEFDPSTIFSSIEKAGKYHVNMGKVIYSRDKQLKVLREAACLFFELHKNSVTKERPIPEQKMFAILAHGLYLLGHFFKPQCFEIENEFRITLAKSFDLEDSENDEVNFFNRDGVMIPYKDICFEAGALKSICISPTMNGTRAKDGALILSRKKFGQITRADIKSSRIPVRY